MLKDLLFFFVGGLITVIVQLYPLFIVIMLGTALFPLLPGLAPTTTEILIGLILYLEYIAPSTFVVGALHMITLKWLSVKRPALFLLFASLVGAIFGCLNTLLINFSFRIFNNVRLFGDTTITYSIFSIFSICDAFCGLANGVFYLYWTARHSRPDDTTFNEEVRRLFRSMWQGGLCIAVAPLLLRFAYESIRSGFSFNVPWDEIPFYSWAILLTLSLSGRFAYGLIFIMILSAIDRPQRSWKVILALGPFITIGLDVAALQILLLFSGISHSSGQFVCQTASLAPALLFGMVNAAIYLFLRRRAIAASPDLVSRA